MKKYEKVISKKEINKRLNLISHEINQDYKNKELIFLVILSGGMNLAVDLSRKIKSPVAFNFLKIKSYKNNVKTKIYDLKFIEDISITNKHVIIVEDIIETGETISNVIDIIKPQNPLSVSVVTLFSLKKLPKLKIYTLFENKPDGFLIGYGFDDYEFSRNLDYIGIIKK